MLKTTNACFTGRPLISLHTRLTPVWVYLILDEISFAFHPLQEKNHGSTDSRFRAPHALPHTRKAYLCCR
ncbi:MAG TPA: hypothetical protein DCY03_10510 [Planctomycetaceae bacterium]|nr:hypothetical protein [Planctomycetaceae bacterium]